MSDLRVNTIGNLSGTATIDVADLIKSEDWNGVDITQAEVEALGVTVQGTGFTAKKYPDNSIVGSTSNGNFEMRPNGELSFHYTRDIVIEINEQSGLIFQKTDMNLYDYPIVFIDIPFRNNTTTSQASTLVWIGGINSIPNDGTTTQYTSVAFMSSVARGSGTYKVAFSAMGRWKP